MGGHAKPKEVVYKDTNDFEYTPKYVYPVSILNRYLFFWGTAKKFKAAINFAKHFLAPNHICFVYLLGEINTGTVEKAYADVDLSATPLVVSWSANVQQAVATYDQLYKDGLDIAEKNFPSPEYIEENHLANLRRAINATDIAERDREIAQTVYDTYKGYYDKMMAKRMAMQEFLDEFTRGGLQVMGSWCGSIPSYQDEHFAALTEIAKQIYPMGIEMMNPSQSTSYRSGGLEKVVMAGVAHEKKFGLNLAPLDEEQEPVVLMYNRDKSELLRTFKDKTEAVKETGISDLAIWRCYMNITDSVKLNDNQRVAFEKRYETWQYPSLFVHYVRELQHKLLWENTRFSIQDFKEELSKPPYGYYDCGLYAYLLGYAMKDLVDGKHKIQIILLTETLEDRHLVHFIAKKMDERVTRRDREVYIIKQSDIQTKTVDMLRRMFKITDENKSFLWTCTCIRQWLEQNVRFGCLDCVSHELFEVIGEYKHEKDYEEILYPLLKANYKQIKAAVQSIDEITKTMMVKDFGQEITDQYLNYVSRYYTRQHARSWVWSKNVLWEEVQFVANHHQCADCGKLILATGIETEGKSLTFTEKDIIGINRKLLGRDITKFYCIPCLCDVMDCDAQAIMDKVEQFKEEGCTLFQ